MKPVITSILLLLSSVLLAQPSPPRPIHFRNGSFQGSFNKNDKRFSRDFLKTAKFENRLYTILQFGQLPDEAKKKELRRIGIILSDYISDNAYYAEIKDNITPRQLSQHSIEGAYKIEKRYKIADQLQQQLEAGSLKITREEPLAVSLIGTLSETEAILQLEQLGARIVPNPLRITNTLYIIAPASSIGKIADLPFVSYLNNQVLRSVPVNNNNRATHGLDALSAPSGRGLQGKGVTIGIGDNSNPSTHIDFAGRLIIRTPDIITYHGTHTIGTAAGAGIINPVNKGMAPKAAIVSQSFTGIIADADTYLSDYNMILTNNSYYTGADFCPGDGVYDNLSQFTDYQLNIFPTLLHVFASGNDGVQNCSPYTSPYATVKSGFQCAKNVLTVGNLDDSSYIINPGSSVGPVKDGRLKPEVVAGGTKIISTFPNNDYGSLSGTSMACPTVTGTLALLYERYRQLNGNMDPSAALIKAITCNSADDLGRPGPDFQYGFGMLNARKAVEAIEQTRYFTNSITNTGTKTHSISVPSGAHQLKVMLYWSDRYGAINAAKELVNNLDLTVTTPSSVIHYPLILNPAPGAVTNNAIEGADNTNNIEQVVINTPVAGSFTITVKGTSVPFGPQPYVITYEIIEPSVTVEYPFGNETFVPGEKTRLRWTAYGGNSNSFTIEYSDNNGTSWTTINNNFSKDSASYYWTVPSTPTDQGLIRVTRNISGYSDVSDFPFVILGQPILSVTNPCQGYVQLDWTSVPSASNYEIMMLKNDSMSVIASTNALTYTLNGLSKDSTYWFSVRAINNSAPGRRAIAQSIRPNSGACSLSVFNNDLTMDSLLTPVTGRQHTMSQLGTAAPRIRIKNLGNNFTSGNVIIFYQVNGGVLLSDTIISPAITAHKDTIVDFTRTTDFSAAGSYTIKAWVKYAGDPNNINDTVTAVIKQLANSPISLITPLIEGFETTTDQSYIQTTFGFEGSDRCDFKASNSNGRARTFVNSGFARTGTRSITLDQILNKYKTQSTADSLVMTFNLASYHSPTHQIDLRFYYQNRGIDTALDGNKVWIRGNETAAWIPVFTLPIGIMDIGQYHSATVDVTAALNLAGQDFSSSFQVKLGEQGFKSANTVYPSDSTSADNGVSYDDLTFTLSTPLPLTIGSFTASKAGSKAALKWTTLQETQTSGFIIEKSTDGISYINIGSIKAAGNSSTERTYTFTDHTPANGTNYYRLKMVDLDGKYTYSEVRSLTFESTGLSVSLYPNPVREGVLYINTSIACNRIEVRNIKGQLIKAINVSGRQNNISLTNLTKGTYIITIRTAEGNKIEKVVVE